MQPELADRQPLISVASNHVVPQSIRDYELLEKIGAGGMGTVYKARHAKLKREVAFKILPAEHLHDPAAVRRFTREMEAVGKVAHPNIVSALDAGEVDGTHYLAMELIDGIDLSNLVGHHGQLPVADAAELIRQAAVGLQRAHECGLVHRDIKPSNLMLAVGQDSHPPGARQSGGSATSPTVKILDLGLALFSGHDERIDRELTGTGQIMGTLRYMAPEQAEESHAVDIRADIYSLGATLFKLLTGEPPFSGERYNSPVKLLRALAMEEPPSIASIRADLPAELVAIVDRMLAKDPAQRYESPNRLPWRSSLLPLATTSPAWRQSNHPPIPLAIIPISLPCLICNRGRCGAFPSDVG